MIRRNNPNRSAARECSLALLKHGFHQPPRKKSVQRNLGRPALQQLPYDQTGCRRQQNPVTKVSRRDPAMRQPGATNQRQLVARPRTKPAPPLHHRGGSDGRPQLCRLGVQPFHHQRLHPPIEPRPLHRGPNHNRPAPWAPGRPPASAKRMAGQAAGAPGQQTSVLSGALPPQQVGAPARNAARPPPMPRNSSQRRPRSPFPSAFSLPLLCSRLVMASTSVSCCTSTPAAATARGRAAHRSRGSRLASSIQQNERPSVANPGMRLSASCALRLGQTMVSLG